MRMRRVRGAMAVSSESAVRKRRTEKRSDTSPYQNPPEPHQNDSPPQQTPPEPLPSEKQTQLHTGTYWLTRIILLRSISFIYCE